MEQLIQRLNSIPNSYYEFIDSVIDYAESQEVHFKNVMKFLDENPSVTPSDVIKFISLQQDFYADSAPNDLEMLVG